MEMKVPKSLIIALWVIAIGLVLNGLQPFLSTPANAWSDVQKVTICNASGSICADVQTAIKNNTYETANYLRVWE